MKRKKSAKFIVLEGGEGAGKSSNIILARKALEQAGIPVLHTREPGGTEVGEAIRIVIFQGFENAEPLTTLLLYCAARSELAAKVLVPTLKSGTNVLYDRFAASTFAYQLCAQGGESLEGVFETIHHAFGPMAVPDLYVFLDVDPEVGLARATRRGEPNSIDEAGLAFHKRVRRGYLKFFKKHPHVTIDANLPLEAVSSQVIEVVLGALQE